MRSPMWGKSLIGPSVTNLAPWRKQNRIHDCPDALALDGKSEAIKGSHHAPHHTTVGQVRAAVAQIGYLTIHTDDESHGDTASQIRVRPQAVLVAEAKTPEVLADDALNNRERLI